MTLDHVLLVVPNADATLGFFTDVVGLRIGERPPFRFPGWWLYAGEQAVVHIALGPARGEGGAVDHVAFRLDSAASVRQRLTDGGWRFREARVPESGEPQFFIAIPEGPVVELVTTGA